MREPFYGYGLLATSCALVALSSAAAADTIPSNRGTVQINGIEVACTELSVELRGQFDSCLMPDELGTVATLPGTAPVAPGPTDPTIPPGPTVPPGPTDPTDPTSAGCSGALCVGVGAPGELPLIGAGVGDDSSAQLVSGSVSGGDASGQAQIVGASALGGNDLGTGFIAGSALSGEGSGSGTLAGVAAASADGSGAGIVGASVLSGEESGVGSLVGASAMSAAGSGEGSLLGASVADDDGTQVMVGGNPLILMPNLSSADLNAAVLGTLTDTGATANGAIGATGGSGGTEITVNTDGSVDTTFNGDAGVSGAVGATGGAIAGAGATLGDDSVADGSATVGGTVSDVGDTVGGVVDGLLD